MSRIPTQAADSAVRQFGLPKRVIYYSHLPNATASPSGRFRIEGAPESVFHPIPALGDPLSGSWLRKTSKTTLLKGGGHEYDVSTEVPVG